MEPQGSSRSHRAAAARHGLQRSAASRQPSERGSAAVTNLIAAAIAEAEVVTASAPPDASQNKPRLLVESSDPDRTVAALRNILADAGLLFDRGVPVRLIFDQNQGGAAAQTMSPDGLVLMAHTVCRPYALKEQKDGTIKEINVRLPRAFAVMYLDWRGEWRLPFLNGIASAAASRGRLYLLRARIRCA